MNRKEHRKFKTPIKPIKPTPIYVSGWQKSAGEGLSKLRKDVKSGYRWVKEKREARIEAGEQISSLRPKGIFPYKDFDGEVYKFDSWYKSLKPAKELCEELESISMKCKISRIKGKYVVYTKGTIM